MRNANAAARRIFGYRSDEIAGIAISRLVYSFSEALLEPTVSARVPDAGRHEVRRVRGRRKDNSAFPLDISVENVTVRGETLAVVCARRPDPTETSRDTVSMSREALDSLGIGDRNHSEDPAVLLDLVHPEDRDEIARTVDQCLANPGRLDIVHRVAKPDGTEGVVRTVAEFRFDHDGLPVELLGVVFDITDRARIDEALRESERILDAVLNSTTAVIYVKDVAGRYLLVNRRFEELFETSNSALRGKSDFAFLPPVTAEAVRANDEMVVRAGRPLEFEELVPSGDEGRMYISIKVPLRDKDGAIYAVCGVSTDITERKKVEAELESTKRSLERLVDERTAELRESNRKLQEEVLERKEAAGQLQRLIDTAREGIWVIDDKDDTTFVNPRMAELLGYEPGEMLGRSMYDFMPAPPDVDTGRILEHRNNGSSEEHDFAFLRKDGSTIWTLLSTGPVRDKDGNAIGTLAMVTDITERKHAERHQMLLLRELDHRVKNTLATVVALSEMTMAHTRSIEEFSRAFGARIQAMARTHETLASAQWKGVAFADIADLVLRPLGAGHAARIRSEGDAGVIPPRTITPLALALNELGTNALKYGALSVPDGSVGLSWATDESGRFALRWRESGGPRVAAPASEGTGLQLMRGLIEYELGGTLELHFERDGFSCGIEFPTEPD